MSEFKRLKQLYQDDKFDRLLKERGSIYWLKLRSISRKALMVEFCEFAKLDCSSVRGAALFEHIYNCQPNEQLLDEFIAQKYQAERSARKANEANLISELYKMQVFDWGGLYQNSLERTIVDNYVKKIRSYDLLTEKIENEIHVSMRGYVQSSWYNHWTSILIEDIFKDHKKVTPTLGLIKKVDFFLGDVPFDLKVTHFPEGFMAQRRNAAGLSTELQMLKRTARALGLTYNRKQRDKALFTELLTRIEDSHRSEAKTFIVEFKQMRWSIIQKAMKEPKDLIRWLYEEQGPRRFDSANRLFLVLVDKNNFEDSWKMKRNVDLLKNRINDYLDYFDSSSTSRLRVEFDWKDGKRYTALSDVIFIIKK